MKIEITTKTLSGNMGDGWNDQNEANRAYADFFKKKLMEKISDQYENAEIEIEIIPVDNTGGDPGTPYVNVSDVDFDDKYAAEEDIESILNYYMDSIWTEWCGSNEATEYIEED